ncbi:MAG: hypothetical protein MJE77_47105 [Proteobacteria bacterium]|nr:hypothetical protein [Pseudomonadota bacterium]
MNEPREVDFGSVALQADSRCERVTFTLSLAGAQASFTYEYFQPPSQLATIDGLIKVWMAALESCTSTSSINVADNCVPRED